MSVRIPLVIIKNGNFKQSHFFKVEEIFDIFDDDGNEPQGEGPYPFMVSWLFTHRYFSNIVKFPRYILNFYIGILYINLKSFTIHILKRNLNYADYLFLYVFCNKMTVHPLHRFLKKFKRNSNYVGYLFLYYLIIWMNRPFIDTYRTLKTREGGWYQRMGWTWMKWPSLCRTTRKTCPSTNSPSLPPCTSKTMPRTVIFGACWENHCCHWPAMEINWWVAI